MVIGMMLLADRHDVISQLAEALAQAWGNMQFGVRELEQRKGESIIEAFAWDVETNTKQLKIFTVPHEIVNFFV